MEFCGMSLQGYHTVLLKVCKVNSCICSLGVVERPEELRLEGSLRRRVDEWERWRGGGGRGPACLFARGGVGCEDVRDSVGSAEGALH